jgi:hypothetical protein
MAGVVHQAQIIGTVVVSIADVHLIDAPFERWRQRRVDAVPARRALGTTRLASHTGGCSTGTENPPTTHASWQP